MDVTSVTHRRTGCQSIPTHAAVEVVPTHAAVKVLISYVHLMTSRSSRVFSRNRGSLVDVTDAQTDKTNVKVLIVVE